MRSGVHALVVALCAGLGAAGCQPPESEGAAGADAAFEEQQQAGIAQNPEGVSFTVRLVAPTNVFHQGERIPVELSFTSRVPDRFRLNGATYDRSGRLSTERYHVAPAAGVSDPLEEYFDEGIFLGGGLRSDSILDGEPRTFVFDLNEWIRFDAPGPYRLYVESERILPVEEDRWFESEAATSNVLDLEIVPADAAWAAQVLSDAAAAIDAGEDRWKPEAEQTLRYLGTIDAAREMAARLQLQTAAGIQLMLGMNASPHRREVVAALEERLDAPDLPVTALVLNTLAELRAKLDHPRLPAGSPLDAQHHAFWERLHARADVLERYATHLAGRVERKTGAARATSIAALMDIAWQLAHRTDPPSPPPWYARIAARLPAVFADLPADEQRALLTYQWREDAGPAMLPIVRRLAEDAGADPELHAQAQQRLRELVPE